VDLLNFGEADIGIATEALEAGVNLASFPFYSWHHAVVVPAGHPLLNVEKLTLEAVAEHPLITYHEGFTGRGRIDQTFAQAGLAPDIVMAALDADVIKTYVSLGLGVGIIASMAYDEVRDANLRLLPSTDLFPDNTTRIAVRRGHYLRGYAYHFIEQCSAELTEPVVKAAITPAKGLELD
jgi:LysR family cys regulon transcriptional activator